jgi:hypothetical protein
MILHQPTAQDGIGTKTRTQRVDPFADRLLPHHAPHTKHGEPQSLDAKTCLHPLKRWRKHASHMTRIRTRCAKYKTSRPARGIRTVCGEFDLPRAAFKRMQLNAHRTDKFLHADLQHIESHDRTVQYPLCDRERPRTNWFDVLHGTPECLIEPSQCVCAET